MPEIRSIPGAPYNQRLNLVEASKIRAFDTRISKIEDLIKLTIGEPDLDTPEHIKEAALIAMQANQTHYTDQVGTQALREAIAGYLKRQHALTYQPDTDILVTVGATEAIYAVLETLVNPGDRFVIPSPAFALYEPIIRLLGGEVIDIDTSVTDFKLDPAVLDQVLQNHPEIKAVIMNYPNNPSGVTLSEGEVHALAKVIKRHAVLVITDEIYSDLTYDHPHYSLARDLPDQAIYISGVSKSYAMTGWRIGFVAAPADFIAHLWKVHAYLVTCPSAIDQAAAREAFEKGDADIQHMRDIYQERRDFIYQALAKLDVELLYPAGTFYLFVRVPASFKGNDEAFALWLAKTAKVGVIPGSVFGRGGRGYVRISYAASLDNLKEAMKRIEEASRHGLFDKED